MAYGGLSFPDTNHPVPDLAVITEYGMVNSQQIYHINIPSITHLPRMFVPSDFLQYWIKAVAMEIPVSCLYFQVACSAWVLPLWRL